MNVPFLGHFLSQGLDTRVPISMIRTKQGQVRYFWHLAKCCKTTGHLLWEGFLLLAGASVIVKVPNLVKKTQAEASRDSAMRGKNQEANRFFSKEQGEWKITREQEGKNAGA